MSEDTIVCPQCHTAIEISGALSARFEAEVRRQFEQERKSAERELMEREKRLSERQGAVAAAEERLEIEVSQRVIAERDKLELAAIAKAKEDVAVELRDQAQQLADAKSRMAKAEESELALRKEKRDLEEQQKSLELTISRRLDVERKQIRDQAMKEADEQREFKDAEKSKIIDDLRRQISDLQRRSEQGSQQLQGEVMELSLEDRLRRLFPADVITPVPKGVHGGDVVHQVHDGALGFCGTILWESKRTKNWTDGWLAKLRDDQRAAKAEIAILVSVELPDGITTFGQVNGVWICAWKFAAELASVLRGGIVQLATANRALEGRQDKMVCLYQYLSGSEFKHRVEGIVESFVTLQSDMEKERRSMERVWANRDKQLRRAILHTAGMYGDLQGIVGASLQGIKQLETSELPGDDIAQE